MAHATPDILVALSDSVAERSNGEVRREMVSDSGWTVTEFGHSRTVDRRTAESFFKGWDEKLTVAEALALSAGERETALRAVLYRTASGGWEVQIQTLDGPPRGETWPMSTSTTDAVDRIYAFKVVAAEHGYRPVWSFPVVRMWFDAPEQYASILVPARSAAQQ